MEFTIAHETTYAYPEPVHESYTVLHLRPRTDQHQFCVRYDLRVIPHTHTSSYVDRLGNEVQHFAILREHRMLTIVARSNVVTLRPARPEPPSEATRSALEREPLADGAYDYLHESTYVTFARELDAFVAELPLAGERIGLWCHEVSRAIHRRFDYDTAATSVHSTVVEALNARAGVCQDYAHVMIAVLRKAGIPARYASGYIYRGSSDDRVLGAEASHAWCEAYLPPYGWVGFDPTNDRLIDDAFAKVAIGRDYRDVSPVRGVYKGSQASEMAVNVAMEALQAQQQ